MKIHRFMRILFLAGFLMSFFCAPALAGDPFDDQNIMAVVTGVPGEAAAVDVNIPQAGYHYEAAIPVGQIFVAGTILEVLDVSGNYLELKFRDGTTKRMGPGESYTIPKFEYALDTKKVPGTANEYEVTETYVQSSETPTPLPEGIKGSIEDIGDAIDAYDAGEIDSGGVFSIIQNAIDSVMSFVDGLFSGSGS